MAAKRCPCAVLCFLQYHGIRNDQHGARGDYIFVADAADYADKVKGLLRLQETPQAPQQQQQQHLQPQLQQPPDQDLVHQARGISLSSALSAAFILRVSLLQTREAFRIH